MNNIEIISLIQNTPEWLAFRQNHIGASDAPIIMNESPWVTPYQLWQQKLGLLPPLEENDAMRRGKEKEEIARKDFESQKGIYVKPAVIKNRKFDYLMASLDGYSSCGKYALEIKVPGRQDHESAMDGVIPEKYEWQLLQQMIVCNLQSIFYFSWNETSNKIIEFFRDQEKENKYLTKAKEFWNCIQNLKDPPLTIKDYVKKTDKEFLQAEYDYLDAKKIREEAEEREKMYRNRLIELSGDQCCQGNNIRLTKYMVKGRVDTEAIIRDSGIDKEKYRKPNTISWRLS